MALRFFINKNHGYEILRNPGRYCNLYIKIKKNPHFYTIFINILLIIFIIGCSSGSKHKFIIEHFFNDVLHNGANPQLKDSIRSGDGIFTGVSSYCIITDSTSLILLYSRSSIQFEQMSATPSEPLLFKIEKGIVDFYSNAFRKVIIQGNNYIFDGKAQAVRCIREGDVVDLWFLNAKGTLRCSTAQGEISKNVYNTTRFSLIKNSLEANLLQPGEIEEMNKIKKIQQNNDLNYSQLLSLQQYLQSLGDSNIREMILYGLLKYKKGPLQMVITKNGNIFKGFVSITGKNLVIETINTKTSVPQFLVKYILDFDPNNPVSDQVIKRLR